MRVKGISSIKEALAEAESEMATKTTSTTTATFNFAGFVIEFSTPRKSHGTDYMVTLAFVDSLNDKLKANLFAATLHHLPRIRSSNHFILLYKFQIRKHKDQFYAVSNKKYSTFAVFDPKRSTHTPFQASPSFDLQTIDFTHFQSLVTLTNTYQPLVERNEYLISLRDLGKIEFFDLVCQVVHVANVGAKESMLFVWDGTDAPPLDLENNLAEADTLPLEVEPRISNISILQRFPRVGTVLRVEAHVNISMHFQEMGQWLKIRNMTYQIHAGLWLGKLLPTSKFTFLPHNDQTVLECERALDDRGLGKESRLPFWSNPLPALTVIDSTHLPFSTLMDLITQAEDDITVRCVVRVVAVSPFDVEKFCIDGRCGIILTLEDPTARIHASLNGHDRGMFFEELSSDALKRRKMHGLLGLSLEDTNPYRNPPWIQCCIKSDASRSYAMCRTKLVA